MNIQHMRYFIAIAEANSITAAAETLRISQPSLSRQIRAFESEIGCQLLERGARSISLTSKGSEILREGKIILRHIDIGISNIRQIVENDVIYCGYAPSLGGDLLKRAIASFAQRHADVKIVLRDQSSKEMKNGITKGKLDLCIDVADSNSGIKWATLLQKEFALAIPHNHPLITDKPRRTSINVEELQGERFLVFSRYDYSTAWEQILGYFVKNGVTVEVAGEFDGIGSMSLALEAGLGIALVVKDITLSAKVKLLPILPKPAPICVSVGWSSQRALNSTKAAFVEELKLSAED